MTSAYKFALIEKTLSDRSHVYDVVLTGPWNMRFSCVTLRDADEFMEKIRGALTAHTNDAIDDGYRMGFERA